MNHAIAKTVAIGTRKIVLGVQAERPELVVLSPDASGRFFVGHWSARACRCT